MRERRLAPRAPGRAIQAMSRSGLQNWDGPFPRAGPQLALVRAEPQGRGQILRHWASRVALGSMH
jgi:hypothetical protein